MRCTKVRSPYRLALHRLAILFSWLRPSVAVAAACLGSAGRSPAAEAVAVRADAVKLLALDPRLVAETHEVRLVMGQVQKESRNPLFTADRPWENALNNLYPNVVYDPQRGCFRLWYKYVLAATHQDLAGLVQAGKFREDLFYRIHVVRLELPPLRQRREDIPLLIDHFIAKFNRLQGKDVVGVADEVLARLMEYDFPGNVRELENVVEHAFVLCRGGLIQLTHLPPQLRGPAETWSLSELSGLTLAATEQWLIRDASPFILW